jgi:hypothetical protein
MIQMPRRSITRFFIPLIDVLILLFCIFLLLEYNAGSKFDQQSVDVEMQAITTQSLQEALIRTTKENEQFQEDRPQLQELAKLREENERLKAANQMNLQDRTFIRVIDIESKDGTLTFRDENDADQPAIKIGDAKAAQALIDRHTKEAQGRELYYYFMPPRPFQGYPTAKQHRQYREWFGKVASSLGEKKEKP